jgi:hypothetical protein
MQKILILGAGKFGLKAAQAANRKWPGGDILVVDQDIQACREVEKKQFKTVCEPGILYLARKMEELHRPDWVVPCIPVHVAYEWMKQRLLALGYRVATLPVPDKVARMLPNTMNGNDGALYMSNADFICPDNCSEPDEFCTYTGKPRPAVIHQVLAAIKYENFKSVVLKSRQLGPGVGGYRSKDLLFALDQVLGAGSPVLLSTACKCHGVMHALKMFPETSPLP